MTSPSRIGKYEVIERIGTGTFATVFKCHHPFLERTLAVKVCTAADDTLRRRFSREAEIVADLDHPNIVRVFDFGVSDDGPYIVQEFLDGEDLSNKIRDQEPMTYVQRLSYLLDIAHGLAYAHSKGVVHRDIKPGNVRILGDDRVKILDFGIAKLAHSEDRLTKVGAILGTAGYLPPEQVLGRPADQRADIFSFGALAYHLLTFERPFPGKNVKELLRQVLKVDPEPVATHWSACPAELQDLLTRCMEKEPGGRYSSFAPVISELAAIAGQLDPCDGAERPPSGEFPAVEPHGEGETHGAESRSADAHGTIPLEVGPNRPQRRWWRFLNRIRLPRISAKTRQRFLARLNLGVVDRVFGSRAVGLSLIAFFAVLLLVVLVWAAGRGSGAEEALANLPRVVSTGVEPPPSAERGELIVAAAPWGVVARVTTADGSPIDLPPERVTPLSLPVGPGRYRIEISNPYAPENEICFVDVASSRVGRCDVRFYEMDATEYFKEGGWWP